MFSQISENKDLTAVFQDLFDPEGCPSRILDLCVIERVSSRVILARRRPKNRSRMPRPAAATIRYLNGTKFLAQPDDADRDAPADYLVGTGCAGSRSLVPHSDIPLQRVSDAMLRRMRRGTRRRDIDALLDRIRQEFREPTIRSTFIVGHPGEAAGDFRELLRFVRTAGLDRIGLFRYSDEEGTAAFDMGDKVPRGVSWTRFRALRSAARAAMREKQRALRGRVVEVLVDGPAAESEWLRVGRTAAQAPEIDGVTYLTGGLPPAGKLIAARITRTSDSDLVVELGIGPVS